jgi:hypothetical protein
VCGINCEELLNSCVISRNEGHVAWIERAIYETYKHEIAPPKMFV